jgi:hypothetical protein
MVIFYETKIAVDKYIRVLFSQLKDLSPVLESTAFDTYLSFGIDVNVAFIFFLPRLARGESGMLFVTPLAQCESRLFFRFQGTNLHGSSRIIS